MDDRILKEKIFHNDRFAEDSRKHLDKYYSISKLIREDFFNTLSKNVANKKLLEYGCGEGSYSLKLVECEANVFGIDISEVAIEKAKNMAIQKNLDQKVSFEVMNAEQLIYADCFFDRIYGNAILHHLDLDNSLKELNRVLKEGGFAIFMEPLGHNPFINLYRLLTKQLRTEDEHPLRQNELNIFEKYFKQVEIKYYNLFTLLAIPFRSTKYFDKILHKLSKIDEFLFRFPFFQKNAWMIIIKFSKIKM